MSGELSVSQNAWRSFVPIRCRYFSMLKIREFCKPLHVAFSLLILHLSASFLFGGSYSSLLKELPQNQAASNCGINVTAFTLAHYKIQFKLEKLAAELGTNESWDQPIDLFHIKSVLEKSKLITLAYKDATINDVLSKMESDPNAIAILHLKSEGSRIGHYIILAGRSQYGVLFVDVGSRTEWISRKDLNDVLKDDFSGLCLFTSLSPSPDPIYALDGNDISVNLGEVTTGPGSLFVSFALKNPTNTSVKLSGAKGGCGCFQKAMLDGAVDGGIAPDKTGKMIFTFDRQTIGIGSVQREVLLSFQGLPQEHVKVIVKCHVHVDVSPVQLTWFPENINLGLIRDRKELGAQELTILSPPDVSLGEPVLSSKGLRVLPVNSTGNDERSTDEFGRRIDHFIVDVSGLGDGAIDETVTFPTSDKNVQQVVVHIQAQINARSQEK